jgi:hypothetical protein
MPTMVANQRIGHVRVTTIEGHMVGDGSSTRSRRELTSDRSGPRTAQPARHLEDGGPSSPGERALEAMAHAVRLARELAQEEGNRSDAADAEARPVLSARAAVSAQEPSQPSLTERIPHGAHVDAVLRASAAVAAAMVFGLGGALAALHLDGPSAVAPSSARPTQSQSHSTSVHAEAPATTYRGTGSARSSVQHQATAAPAQAPVSQEDTSVGGSPRLVSVTPSGGGAGQVVKITGVDLYSQDGVVQGSLGGAPAPTRCPSETMCLLTLPTGLGAPQRLSLVVTTQAGASNPLPFSYW